MFSCESCFPLHRMLYFLFLILTKLTCKKETVVLAATVGPQTDVKLTAAAAAAGVASSPPSETFTLDRMWGNGRVCVEDFKDRGPGHVTGPHPSPPTPPQSTNTQKGTHVT